MCAALRAGRKPNTTPVRKAQVKARSAGPGENATDYCEGIARYNQNRPSPVTLQIVNAVIFGVFAVAWVVCFALFYHLRREPRFYKIRPFFISAIYCFGGLLLSIALTAVNGGRFYNPFI